ncbi:hypothetical protein VTN00DRAFT_3016 [Thermoascus crustaceus]|uniref:uncharacterized protein n=1 Tax=Thermoascus crustaceus TaxID=5088 RepID=UPI003744A91A
MEAARRLTGGTCRSQHPPNHVDGHKGGKEKRPGGASCVPPYPFLQIPSDQNPSEATAQAISRAEQKKRSFATGKSVNVA